MKYTSKDVEVTTTNKIPGYSIDFTVGELYFIKWVLNNRTSPCAGGDKTRFDNLMRKLDGLTGLTSCTEDYNKDLFK